MHITSRFSLAPIRHKSGRAATHSFLLEDGKPTQAKLIGTHLIRQFDCDAGFMLVTDYNRPRDEVTTFSLVRRDFRVASSRKFGGPLSSWLLSEVRWIDARHFRVRFHGSEILLFRIRDWGLPWVLPRLTVERKHKRS